MNRLVQAANRSDGVKRRRMAQIAEMVANGATIGGAAARIGLGKDQARRLWAAIKADLGEQAR